MTENRISNSRFHMWRAVFAIAHVDGHVSEDEAGFAKEYLAIIPFNEEQRKILYTDLEIAQSVSAMYSQIILPADRADFFQFATMMARKDGNYAQTERNLLEYIQKEQIEGLDIDAMRLNIRAARQSAVLRRALEDENFTRQAQNVTGFSNVIRFVSPWLEMRKFQQPSETMFHLWRAVFSLVHADDELADEERGYIEGMMDVFRFSEEQHNVVRQDLETAPDTLGLFEKLRDKIYRKQFFVMARTIVWCDGFLHEKEMEVIDRIKDWLGPSAAEYSSELRWIDRRPDTVRMNNWETGEEVMMKSVVRQMLDFYNYAQKHQENAA